MSSGRATTCTPFAFFCGKKKIKKPAAAETVIVIDTKEKAPVTSKAEEILENDFIPYDQIELGEQIDSGAFGGIYQAQWRKANIIVKKCTYDPKSINVDETTQEDCFNEREIMRTLTRQHAPNVVHYYGYTQRSLSDTNEEFSILMQHVPGGSLADYIDNHQKDPFNLPICYRILQDVIKALVFLHTLQILHRDIKGANILLSNDFRAVLCDFGLSVMLKNGVPNDSSGSPAWLAPEAWRHDFQTPKTDVYSFAITILELCGWSKPFGYLSKFKIAQLVIDGKRPDLSVVTNDKLRRLTLWGILDNAAQRPSSAIIDEELATPIDEISERLQGAPQYHY